MSLISAVIEKILPSTPALHFPSSGLRQTLPSVKSGSDRAAGLGPRFQAGSVNAESGVGNLQEEAGGWQGDGGRRLGGRVRG